MEAANTLVNTVSTMAATNTNLEPAEKELLRWHNCLGHIGMRKVQFLMQTGVLATSEATRHLHAAACKLTNLPCAQHANLANNAVAQSQARP